MRILWSNGERARLDFKSYKMACQFLSFLFSSFYNSNKQRSDTFPSLNTIIIYKARIRTLTELLCEHRNLGFSCCSVSAAPLAHDRKRSAVCEHWASWPSQLWPALSVRSVGPTPFFEVADIAPSVTLNSLPMIVGLGSLRFCHGLLAS